MLLKPKLQSLLFLVASFSILPTLLFVSFALSVIAIALGAAITFSFSLICFALVFLVPALFVSVGSALALWLWGAAAYVIIRRILKIAGYWDTIPATARDTKNSIAGVDQSPRKKYASVYGNQISAVNTDREGGPLPKNERPQLIPGAKNPSTKNPGQNGLADPSRTKLPGVSEEPRKLGEQPDIRSEPIKASIDPQNDAGTQSIKTEPTENKAAKIPTPPSPDEKPTAPPPADKLH